MHSLHHWTCSCWLKMHATRHTCHDRQNGGIVAQCVKGRGCFNNAKPRGVKKWSMPTIVVLNSGCHVSCSTDHYEMTDTKQCLMQIKARQASERAIIQHQCATVGRAHVFIHRSSIGGLEAYRNNEEVTGCGGVPVWTRENARKIQRQLTNVVWIPVRVPLERAFAVCLFQVGIRGVKVHSQHLIVALHGCLSEATRPVQHAGSHTQHLPLKVNCQRPMFLLLVPPQTIGGLQRAGREYPEPVVPAR